MSDPLEDLDQQARAASRGLHEHVLQRVDAEQSLHALGARRPAARSRLLAVAAVVLVVTGSVAMVGRGDDRSTVDVEELTDLEPGVLTLLGPRDGRDSIQLPVTAEPSTGLRNGDRVIVTGSGFSPGEQVGIVQCAREAGGATPEVRGGVDGCYLGAVQYADADDAGNISGTYTVSRLLTTPMTGTVDCAAEADRCIIAAGAISDYDRSGGMPLRFEGGGEPLDLPSVRVAPADALADGQVVNVSGEGFKPHELLDLVVCAADPSGCWSTGAPVEFEPEDQRGEGPYAGLRADGEGRVEGEVPMWRFLPGSEPGTYIDCATSSCSLRVMSQHTSPPTVPLGFESGGTGPVAPSLSITPTEGLAPGDEVVVRGAGFQPGSYFYVSLCGGPAGQPDLRYSCASSSQGDERIGKDGTFVLEMVLPSLQQADVTETTLCGSAGGCGEMPPEQVDVRCDGVETSCAIVVESYQELASNAPVWSPVPVPITFR